MTMHPLAGLLSAFMAGATFATATAIAVRIRISRAGRNDAQRYDDPVLRRIRQDPRDEAIAILTICNWSVAQAYRIVGQMLDHDAKANQPFWRAVSECIDIIRAGKEEWTV
jgi:hypothetical protein